MPKAFHVCHQCSYQRDATSIHVRSSRSGVLENIRHVIQCETLSFVCLQCDVSNSHVHRDDSLNERHSSTKCAPCLFHSIVCSGDFFVIRCTYCVFRGVSLKCRLKCANFDILMGARHALPIICPHIYISNGT
jgi:hypothetical protein